MGRWCIQTPAVNHSFNLWVTLKDLQIILLATRINLKLILTHRLKRIPIPDKSTSLTDG